LDASGFVIGDVDADISSSSLPNFCHSHFDDACHARRLRSAAAHVEQLKDEAQARKPIGQIAFSRGPMQKVETLFPFHPRPNRNR